MYEYVEVRLNIIVSHEIEMIGVVLVFNLHSKESQVLLPWKQTLKFGG